MDEIGTTRARQRRQARFSPSDAVLWQIERDPLLRSTITAVALLDRAPDWDRLVAKVERATWTVPRLRSRVVEPTLGLGAPRWERVDDVDLGYHLRRVRVPRPGDLRQVLDLAQPIAMAAFDPARPLWELTLVDGLQGGRSALIQKFHHCLTDGVGGIELALSLLEPVREQPVEPDGGPVPPWRAPAPGPAPSRGVRGVFDAVVDGVVGPTVDAAADVLGALGAAPAAVRTTLLHPAASLRHGRELARVAARTLAPVSSSSDVPVARGLARRLHAVEVPLVDLHDAGHVGGGTVNDAFLAAVIEGIRRYHARHGLEVEDLAVTMPISFRRSSDGPGGNQFSPARFVVPAALSDPVERMQALGAIARSWQHAPVREVSSSIAFVLDKLPPPMTTAVLGSMLTGIDTVVTNVPGWSEQMFLAGAEVVRQFGFAPTSGAALNVALVSHGSTACIGIEVDLAAVPDDDVLVDALVEGFRDVLAVIGRSEVVRT